jgi:hypothetical protein
MLHCKSGQGMPCRSVAAILGASIMALVTSLYASTALKASRAAGSAKVKAGQRHMHKGERPSAVTILRPDDAGELRVAAALVPVGKRVRWDAAGMYVERA